MGVRMPYLQAQVEDGQGDRWQEDGSVQLPAAAAPGVRHLQELRGPVPRCLHGWQRRGDAWQSHLVRAQGRGWRCWRQEEVSAERHISPGGRLASREYGKDV